MNRPRLGRICLQHAYESAACQVFGDEHFGLQQQAGTGQRCRAQAMAVVGAIPTGFAREQDRKIVVIGASGTLGRAVVAELEQGGAHEIIRVGHTQGEQQLDITNADSVAAPFDRLGQVDAIVSTAGNLFFGPLTKMTAADFNVGLQDKLLGQVRLALVGKHYLNDGGSITLTTGIVGQEAIAQGANPTAVNAGVEGFVRAAACELPRSIRINAVSPTVLTESMEAYGPFFPGFEPVPAARAALAYRRSVEGVQSGRVYRVG